MKFRPITASLLLLASAGAADAQQASEAVSATAESAPVNIRFVNIPYAEGTLYVAANEGDKMLEGTIVQLAGDEATVSLPLHKYDGQKIQLRAFQDLNNSGNIEFDEMGRPTEPVLLKDVKVTPELNTLDVELVIY